MKKMKFIFGVLLCSLVWFSCKIDEERYLLFQLKDSLIVAGNWQSGVGVDGFQFASDSTFTAKIGGRTGGGTFRYYETTNESIFDQNNKVAQFVLTWKSKVRPSDPTTQTLEVFKQSNGDLYFRYSATVYKQVS